MKKTTKTISVSLLIAALGCGASMSTILAEDDSWKAASLEPVPRYEYVVVNAVKGTNLDAPAPPLVERVDDTMFNSSSGKEYIVASRALEAQEQAQTEITPLDLATIDEISVEEEPAVTPLIDCEEAASPVQISDESVFCAKTTYSLQNHHTEYIPQHYAHQHCRRSCKPSFWDKIKVYGWVQAGIQANTHGSTNEYVHNPGPTDLSPASRNLAPLSGNSYLFMTQQPTDLHVNQVWLGVGKALDTKNGFDWGFQMDLLWGTDGKFGQSFGDKTFDHDWGTGDYYLSFAQLYAELGYHNLSVKVGKTATPFAHEPLAAPASFFYSHAYLNYNTPLTYSGVIATYKINRCWSASAGWVAGQHNSLENRFDDNAFVGSLVYTPTDKTSLSYNLYIGESNGFNKRNDAHWYNRFHDKSDDTIMTLRYTRQLNKCWFYMIEGIYTSSDVDAIGANTDYFSYAYGVNQTLTRTINAKWSVGIRGEWLHSKGMIFDFTNEGTDLYEITLGANWKPVENFTLRPELRFDWTDYKNGVKPFANGEKANQISLGCAAILSF